VTTSTATHSQMTGSSVLLAAGGTGGHLFPAFALAQELARRGVAVDLMTDMRGDRYGRDFPARAIYQVPAATVTGRNPLNIAKTGLTLSRGIAAAYKLLGEIKPGVVIGFGGYPTFPPLMAARARGIPTAVHEQNAVLGRANKLLGTRVAAIATSFETTKLVDGPLAVKARFTGNPVRDLVIAASQISYNKPTLTSPFTLVVFGGSQGARFFSDCVPTAIAMLPSELRTRLFVVQQARDEDVARVEAAYHSCGIRAKVAPFFSNLPDDIARAQLVLGRAGASTVAELTVIGRPSILVPLPHAIDNDQLENATRLADAGGAICVAQNVLTPERLAKDLTTLINSPDDLEGAAAAAKSQGRPDAVKRLADLVISLKTR
jgi:UDP-N-acetylglucosamine--N-acetylmuramyl-(pentapeptide) pyrophosphoryl-undecaprenol N-acetylglucosamine transferase